MYIHVYTFYTDIFALEHGGELGSSTVHVKSTKIDHFKGKTYLENLGQNS